jgi:ElaB/YqjD/DUF883 family membrane-anchored ribosome-binding protein
MDDTTRGVGRGDELSGRSDETSRNYADQPTRSAARRSTRQPAGTSADRDELDPESDRRAREIQSDIAQTRAEMSETIEAIQEKLRPGNLVSDATEKVKAVTTEKVKSMADTASGTAQGMVRETRERANDVFEGVRQNPIPALMIGAGVAWLLMGNRKSGNGRSRQAGWSAYGSAYGSPRYGTYQETDYYADADYSEANDVRGLRGYGRSSEGLTARAREAAEEARRTARRTAYRTQNGFQRLMQQNPLLVGAAAAAVGAAVGASLPETERENELMGEARDNVIDRAQEAARDAADTVREVAGEAVEKVTDKVGSTGPKT